MWGRVRNGITVVGAAATRATNPHGAAEAGVCWWWRRREPALPGGGGPLLTPACPGNRALHGSAALCDSRKLLRKFLNKHKKKKFWYKSPTVESHLAQMPPSLKSALNLAPPKFQKQDSVRRRMLNVILFKAVRDLLFTCEAGQEVYDLNIELSKATLTSDFSICRMYWRSTGSSEQDDYADKVLQKCAPRIRHLLITHRVMGNVPIIVFVRDKEDAALREVEKLLATADFGPEEEEKEEEEEEENKLMQNDFSEQRSTTTATYLDTNLFGIDHDALNKQITEYKKRETDKAIEGIALSEQQQQQLAEIRRQKKLKWKKAKKRFDDGITPQKYLMDKNSEDCWDSGQETELEYEMQQSEDELEVDDRTTKPE